jgi:hypothetical protein
LVSLSASAALADPIAVGIDAFGSATSINFSGFVNGTLITTQFVGQGLTVSGGLYEEVNGPSALIFAGASPHNAADNFLPPSPGPGPFNTITLTFSTPMELVGMNEISNPGNFNITDVNGSVAYPSSLTVGGSFAGFEDLAGFTSVTLTVTGAVNNAFGIDSLLFAPTPVPEPSSLLPLVTCFLGIGGRAYKSRRS